MEKRLGHHLILRSPTGYKLTELGEEMVAHAAKVEDSVSAFERRLTDARLGFSGSIKVACAVAVGSRLMRSGLIADFQQRFPELRIELVLSDHILDLGAGQADIAIRGVEPRDEALFSRRIGDTAWAIYASNAYCTHNGLPRAISDINGHQIAVFDAEMGEHRVNRWFKEIAPSARIGARCNSISGLLAAAKSGIGLTALPVIIGGVEEDLVQVFEPIRELRTPVYIVTHRDMRDAPRIKAFSSFLVDNLNAFRALFS